MAGYMTKWIASNGTKLSGLATKDALRCWVRSVLPFTTNIKELSAY